MGPPYVIAMACTCIKEGFSPVPVIRLVASFLASTLFRPDNTATLEIFKMNRMFSSKSRRIIHGILMTSSAFLLNVQLVFSILVLYLYGKFHEQIWAVLIAFGNFLLKAIAWAYINTGVSSHSSERTQLRKWIKCGIAEKIIWQFQPLDTNCPVFTYVKTTWIINFYNYPTRLNKFELL